MKAFWKALVAAVLLLPFVTEAKIQPNGSVSHRFPKRPFVRPVLVVDFSHDPDWYAVHFYNCLQGVLNRDSIRVYLKFGEDDQFWLDYYDQRFNIPYRVVADPDSLLDLYRPLVSGYILYDRDMVHSLNVATTMAGLTGWVPVDQENAFRLEKRAIPLKEDLRGRWCDRYQAYEWALENLMEQCNREILGELCVDAPYWPGSNLSQSRDFFIANKVFVTDLSSSLRDRRDRELLAKIYDRLEKNAFVMGWHCCRDQEHEAVALSASHNHLTVMSLHTPNMTVHSGIRLRPGTVFRQRQVDPETLVVRDRVYLALMSTDGDATWSWLYFHTGGFCDPLRGSFKYNWGCLPLGYDLLPGPVLWHYENATPNDYFVAGPAGVTYTYPHLLPDPSGYIAMTNYYCEKTGLRTIHVTNWNDHDWWEEAEIPEFHALLRCSFRNIIGYTRGLNESAFERQMLADGIPVIYFGEGIHRNSDIVRELDDFIQANTNRPLFIYCLVNHTVPLKRIKEALDRLAAKWNLQLVHLDELMLLAQKAFSEGRVTEDFYPNREANLDLLQEEGVARWRDQFVPEMRGRFAKFVEMSETGYCEKMRCSRLGLGEIVPGDVLAFDTIWNSFRLTRLALQANRVYVNNKAKAVADFERMFADVEDVGVVRELYDLWMSWPSEQFTYARAGDLARRLVRLFGALDGQLGSLRH